MMQRSLMLHCQTWRSQDDNANDQMVRFWFVAYAKQPNLAGLGRKMGSHFQPFLGPKPDTWGKRIMTSSLSFPFNTIEEG